jgi:hypothetical protein
MLFLGCDLIRVFSVSTVCFAHGLLGYRCPTVGLRPLAAGVKDHTQEMKVPSSSTVECDAMGLCPGKHRAHSLL